MTSSPERTQKQREYQRGRRLARNDWAAQKRITEPEVVRAASRLRMLKLKVQAMEAYGGKCACCGSAHLPQLTIDHINDDGAAERTRLRGRNIYQMLRSRGYPEGYQVLCAACNLAKHIEGACGCKEPFTVESARVLVGPDQGPGERSKLTEGQVLGMRARVRAGEVNFSQLARETGLNVSSISAACRGATWAHLPGAVACRNGRTGNTQLSDVQVRSIREEFKRGETSVYLATKYGAKPSTIDKVVCLKTYRWVD